MADSAVKLAIVSPTISHFEVPMYRLCERLEGVQSHLFHTDLRDETFVDADYQASISWGAGWRSAFANSGFSTMEQLTDGLLAYDPDVVLMCGFSWPGAMPLFIKLTLRGVPVIQRGPISPLHDPRNTGWKSRVRRLARPWLLRRFASHHYGGSYSQQVFRSAGIADNRLYFVPYSIDTPHFLAGADDPATCDKAVQLRHDLGWSDDDPVLLQIGQMSWVKGSDLTVDIAAAVQAAQPNAKLLVVGSGKCLPDLQKQAEQLLLPGSYAFAGFIPSSETTPYYLASSLVMFPSRYETWARAVNEAMLCRRPCLVTKAIAAAGGLVEDGDNGLVVDACDVQNIAAAIVGFFEEPASQRGTMGERARARAQEFSYEAHLDDLRQSIIETARR
jgi:glycosyltransferase involved in cell wall biosynthesis